MTRDEEQAKQFLLRHQDKVIFGSDCSDSNGEGPDCIGTNTIAILRRLVSDEVALKKIFHDNAMKIMRIT